MKKLLFIGKDWESNEIYLKELRHIFAGFLEIDYCYRDDGQEIIKGNQISKADVILLTNPYSFPDARAYMDEDTKIITMNFTFRRDRVEVLKSFPVGTEALVCFKFYSDAHQAAYTLYNLGVDNLNLYINYKNNKNLIEKKMDLAIVSGDTSSVPSDIHNCFDLGELSIDLATIMDIAMAADVLCDELEARIIRHCATLSLPNDYVSYFFDNSSMANEQLRTITNCIEYGIAIVDGSFNLINCNNRFLSIFNIRNKAARINIKNIPALEHYQSLIQKNEEIDNELIESSDKSKYFLFSKKKINKSDGEFNIFMLLFNDVTQIHALESTFQKQLVKKGHIAKYTFQDIIHGSEKMDEVIRKCEKLSRIDKPTLIIGESGTGKELFAHSIHNASARNKFPFVALNCATIPDSLLESELFGYEEGAFTGAKKGGKIGLFQAANKGTLFLDEIGEITLETQAKLLRALEAREIMKVGGDEIVKVDTKIIAATNRNLRTLVEEGKFRLDLYYRLNTLMVNIPPLRERVEDIMPLTKFFMAQENAVDIDLSSNLIHFLSSYRWEGNIRELRNCIEYMVNICENTMDIPDLPEYLYEEWKNSNSIEENNRKNKDETVHDYSGIEKEHALLALTLIKRYSPGRRKLTDLFHEHGMAISEYQMRKLLQNLHEDNLIVFGNGRGGNKITEKGEALLGE